MENKNFDIDFDETPTNQHFKKSKCLNFYLELKNKIYAKRWKINTFSKSYKI